MGFARLLVPFLGAFQACISVLLTVIYGVAARQSKLIHESTIDDMSGICVKVFLPALIIVNLGSQLHVDNALNYVPVLSTQAHTQWTNIIVFIESDGGTDFKNH